MAPPNNVLFSSDLWLRALESYARDTHLSVKLFDADLRVVLGPIHPTPFFQLFEEVGYDPGMFAECARRCLEQTDSRPAVMVSEFYGLAVVGTSLVLDGKVVGAAVAGYAFVDFSQSAEVQRLARDAGIKFVRLWQVAREQKPVPRQRLMLNSELLQTLGDALLRENLRTRQYEDAVLKLEETARAKEEVHRELQESSAALRENEERYRILFDLGPVAIYSCDALGVIQEFNRRAVELWGRTPAHGDTDERFCGSFKMFRPDGSFMPHEQCPMADVVSGEIPEMRDGEVHIERPDGSRVIAIVNIRPLKDQRGEILGAINCFYDITDRKQAEEALRESEERYRTLFESVDEGFCIIEKVEDEAGGPLDFRYVEANPAFAAQSGVSGVVGRTIRQAFPGEPEEWFATYDAVLRTGEPIRFERGLVTQGRVLELYAFRIGSETERRVAVIFKDITAHKQAEVALLKSEKLAAAGRMAAAVAHEINNPLEAVTNLLYLLRSEMTSEAGSRNLAMAEEELGRVAQITKKTLAFYRDPSSPATVSVSEVIDSALSVLSGKIAEKQILVVRADQPSTIRGLKGELEQLFSNLIANAIDAVSVGGQIEISVHANGEGVVMAVQDNGAGIRQEHLQKLFEPFFSTKQQYKGTGLGLWVANEVARKHGAQIAVKSSTDVSTHGTTFEVTFPTADGQTSLPAAS
jgi:PAS domain S-box-containing protein